MAIGVSGTSIFKTARANKEVALIPATANQRSCINHETRSASSFSASVVSSMWALNGMG